MARGERDPAGAGRERAGGREGRGRAGAGVRGWKLDPSGCDYSRPRTAHPVAVITATPRSEGGRAGAGGSGRERREPPPGPAVMRGDMPPGPCRRGGPDGLYLIVPINKAQLAESAAAPGRPCRRGGPDGPTFRPRTPAPAASRVSHPLPPRSPAGPHPPAPPPPPATAGGVRGLLLLQLEQQA